MDTLRKLFWKGGGIVSLLLTVPFISLLYALGRNYTVIWVTPEMLRLWPNRSIAFTGSSLILGAYLLLFGGIIAHFYFQKLTRSTRLKGVVAGLILGAPLIGFFAITHIDTRTPDAVGTSIAGLVVLYAGWGVLLHQIHRRFHTRVGVQIQDEAARDEINLSRRDFLRRGMATSVMGIIAVSGLGRWLSAEKQKEIARFFYPTNFPPTLNAKLYPMSAGSTYPEMDRARYRPENFPMAACFSGGGIRAYTAAAGQMRGLVQAGLLDKIGAFSGISGGGLFLTLFSYAPADIDDETLLGAPITPEALTPEYLAKIPADHMFSSISNLTDANIVRDTIELEEYIMLTGLMEQDQLYSRVLNQLYLKPFRLDNTGRFMSLDDATIVDCIQRNPQLTPDQFYTVRADRPFPIVGITHLLQNGFNPILRDFECTPFYSGTPQLHTDPDAQSPTFGGGYIENIGFNNSAAPISTGSNMMTFPSPQSPFAIADMVGSTSAFPGAVLDKFGQTDLMPAFYYLKPDAAAGSRPREQSFVDGGIIENLGIVPLLRRHYPVVMVFVNTGFPIGVDGQTPFESIDYSICRLFGYTPPDDPFNTQHTQIFPKEQFDALWDGLKHAKLNHELPMFIDRYEILQPNPFDISPYPGDGKVTVIWFYNDMYQPWADRLPEAVKAIMADPVNRMDTFPNYKKIFHNDSPNGVPEIFYMTPEQMHLLSHMWTTAVQDAADTIRKLT